MDTGKTYYEILGVCETASMKVISDAFVRQMESLDDCSDTLPDGRERGSWSRRRQGFFWTPDAGMTTTASSIRTGSPYTTISKSLSWIPISSHRGDRQ